MNVWTWNYTFFDTLLIGIKIIFVVGPHKYRRLAFPVCRAACPGGMRGMHPFVPCRFNLIWVLGCQWESRAEKADEEWDRETASNPPQGEVILICAHQSVEKEVSCKSAEDAANMLSLERCSQSVWLKHVNPMAPARIRCFLIIYNSDLATSRKSRLWSREGGAVIEAVCFWWLFLRFLKGRRGLSALKKKKKRSGFCVASERDDAGGRAASTLRCSDWLRGKWKARSTKGYNKLLLRPQADYQHPLTTNINDDLTFISQSLLTPWIRLAAVTAAVMLDLSCGPHVGNEVEQSWGVFTLTPFGSD